MQILFLCIKFYRKRTKFIKGRRSEVKGRRSKGGGRRTKVGGLRFEGFDGLSYYATLPLSIETYFVFNFHSAANQKI